jgi:hypothetical protein
MEGCNTPRPELQGWAGSRTDRPAPPEISLKPPDRVTNRNKVLASSFFFMFGGALQHILLRYRMTPSPIFSRSSSFSGRSLPTPTQFWSYSHRGCAWERDGGAHAHMKHRRVTSREVGKLVVVRRQKAVAHGRAQARCVGGMRSHNRTW